MRDAMRLRWDTQGVQSVAVAPGVRALLASVKLAGELVSYLTDFGNSIDVLANAPYATFRVYINGGPLPGFALLTNQVAPATQPLHYFDPILLGGITLIEIYGEMAAGAAGNTLMAVQARGISVRRGESSYA